VLLHKNGLNNTLYVYHSCSFLVYHSCLFVQLLCKHLTQLLKLQRLLPTRFLASPPPHGHIFACSLPCWVWSRCHSHMQC
jgi:hypothetical protein